MFKNKYTKKLLKVIPGGSHTYSRGADTYPSNTPSILKKGKGAYASSGSRANVNPFQWALARLASVLTFGPSLKVDKDILPEYIIENFDRFKDWIAN